MRKIVKEADGSVILNPIKWESNSFNELEAESDHTALILALKTTGFDSTLDEIIEISYLKFKVNSQGIITKLLKEVDMLQEPKNALSEQVKEITFLTDEELQGKQIDWNTVNDDFKDIDFIISFNAQFERPFIEHCISETDRKWVCAYSQIPWAKFGYPKKNLEVLCMYHNFYFDETPGIEKCKALVNLLQKNSPEEPKLYLKILLEGLSEKSYLLIALKSSFDAKWFFNQNKFSYNKPLNMWFKFFDEKSKVEADTLLEDMKLAVYEGIPFNGILIDVDASKKFKSLSEFALLKGNEKIFTKEPPGKYTKPFMLIARNLDATHREQLHSRLYSWVSTGKKHEWIIYVTEEEANREKKWLVENLYHSHFKGTMVPNKDYNKE